MIKILVNPNVFVTLACLLSKIMQLLAKLIFLRELGFEIRNLVAWNEPCS